MNVPLLDAVRTMRLRWLVGRQLRNATEVWDAYGQGRPIPPLLFRNGMVLHHGPGDAPVFLLLEVFANGCYRRRMPSTLHGTVLDLGANIGAFTLDCARRFPRALIHAYEPNPETVATLRRNIAVNGLDSRVRVFAEAVGGHCGTLHLAAGEGHLASTAYGATGDGPGTMVPVVDLRTVLSRIEGTASFVKFDVEGAEADILEAAADVLPRVAEVLGEFHEHLVPGVRDRVAAALGAAGFDVKLVTSRRCGPVFHGRRR